MISRDAQEFARRAGLESALESATEMVGRHFSVMGEMSVYLEDYPEVPGTRSLIVDAPVAGSPDAVAAAHWRFAVEAARVLGLDRERIALMYRIVDSGVPTIP